MPNLQTPPPPSSTHFLFSDETCKALRIHRLLCLTIYYCRTPSAWRVFHRQQRQSNSIPATTGPNSYYIHCNIGTLPTFEASLIVPAHATKAANSTTTGRYTVLYDLRLRNPASNLQERILPGRRKVVFDNLLTDVQVQMAGMKLPLLPQTQSYPINILN